MNHQSASPTVAEGVLELEPQGNGHLRQMEKNFVPGPQDVRVPNRLINKYFLKEGQFIQGPSGMARRRNNRRGLMLGLMATWMLGATFLFIQVNEYLHIGFSAREDAFASIFYGLTGLHGAHVFIGLLLLTVANIRAFRGHYGPKAEDHMGVEVPGIYWHFVDVMWIVVFTAVYIL